MEGQSGEDGGAENKAQICFWVMGVFEESQMRRNNMLRKTDQHIKKIYSSVINKIKGRSLNFAAFSFAGSYVFERLKLPHIDKYRLSVGEHLFRRFPNT